MCRIAWFSPLKDSPVLRSPWVTRQLLPLLPSDWQVELFVDSEDWTTVTHNETNKNSQANFFGRPVFHFLRAFARHREQPFDIFFYQLEDHPACHYIDLSLELQPGVVLFHDIHLNRVGSRRSDRVLKPEDIHRLEEILTPDEKLFRDWRGRGWDTEILDRVQHQGLEQCRLAAAALTTNGQTKRELSKLLLPQSVISNVIPFPFTTPQQSVDRATTRSALNIGHSDFVCGFQSERFVQDRAQLIIESFIDLLDSYNTGNLGRHTKLIWLVSSPAEQKRAASLCRDIVLGSPLARSLSAVDADRWSPADHGISIVSPNSSTAQIEYVAACDCWCALSSGTMHSPYLSLYAALATGVPLLTSSIGASSELPAAVSPTIEVGVGEQRTLTLLFQELVNNPSLCRQLAAAGANYARAAFDTTQTVSGLASLFRAGQSDSALRSRLSQVERDKGLAYRQAQSELLEPMLLSNDLEQLATGLSAYSPFQQKGLFS